MREYISAVEIRDSLSENGINIPYSRLVENLAQWRREGKLVAGGELLYDADDKRIEKYSPRVIPVVMDLLSANGSASAKSVQGSSLSSGIIYHSRQMEEVLSLARKIAESDSDVLILGESGTGKELVARYIAENNPRRKGIFSVNCASLRGDLVGSELLGHSRGAFTGALSSRVGKLELADGEILFLDEIYDLPLPAQETLLRVLDGYGFSRIGSNVVIHPSWRMIFASNKSLEGAVREGHIREDFYYRLPTLKIKIPPLRERREDVVAISEYFLAKLNLKFGQEKKLTKEDLVALREYSWPGNVRQLKHVLEESYFISDGVFKIHLPESEQKGFLPTFNLKELRMIAAREALKATKGNKAEAAKRLGICYTTFYGLHLDSPD